MSFSTLFRRYLDRAKRIPLRLDFKWKPLWTGSPVPHDMITGGDTPFHRMLWELSHAKMFGSGALRKLSQLRRAFVEPYGSYDRFYRGSWDSKVPFSVLGSRVDIYPLSRYKGSIRKALTRPGRVLHYLFIETGEFFLRRLDGDPKYPMPGGPSVINHAIRLFPPGKLGYKVEGGAKLRIFASPNSFKQCLLRPCHDWAMEVLGTLPMDGTFDQLRPLKRIEKLAEKFSFYLSSATDRFPLMFQNALVRHIFGRDIAHAWVSWGLGTNVFLAPESRPAGIRNWLAVQFATGQPLGYLSSWPLFSLSHHFVIWMCAEAIYPGRRFTAYALLGDDVVIADSKVADLYHRFMTGVLGVSISKTKSLESTSGFCEFAKRFMRFSTDLSPVSARMINSIRFTSSVAAVSQMGSVPLRVSMRLRGASYRRYSCTPRSLSPALNRHWYRHMVIYYSPRGIVRLPLPIWLGFPDFYPVHPNHIGRVYFMFIQACRPDWDSVEKTVQSLDALYGTDDIRLVVERLSISQWVEACTRYHSWYNNVIKNEGSVSVDELLDPPGFVFRPKRKTQQSSLLRYGVLFRAFDIVRTPYSVRPLAWEFKLP